MQNKATQFISCYFYVPLQITDGTIHTQQVLEIIRGLGFEAEFFPFKASVQENTMSILVVELTTRDLNFSSK